jgi:hypothetical protein
VERIGVVLAQAHADPKQLKQVAAAKEKSVPYNAVLYLLNETDAFDAHISFSEGREVALRDFWDVLKGPLNSTVGWTTLRTPHVTIGHLDSRKEDPRPG